MDRKFFKDGAIEINSYNFLKCSEILDRIKEKLNMLSDKNNDIINKIRDMNIVILIEGCGQILENKDEEQ